VSTRSVRVCFCLCLCLCFCLCSSLSHTLTLSLTFTSTSTRTGTFGVANLVKVRLSDNIDKCMTKMLGRDIRHLLVCENEADGDRVVGMISIKDVVKCTLAKASAKVERLEVIVQTQDMMRHQI